MCHLFHNQIGAAVEAGHRVTKAIRRNIKHHIVTQALAMILAFMVIMLLLPVMGKAMAMVLEMFIPEPPVFEPPCGPPRPVGDERGRRPPLLWKLQTGPAARWLSAEELEGQV